MVNIQHRLFWLLVLLAQLGIVLLPLTSFYSSLGISGPRFFGFLFQLAFCVPVALLASQKKLLRHNFWAGFFGVSVASLMLGLMSFLSLISHGFSSQAFGFLAFVFVMQVTCVFGQFIYVYSSPHLWRIADDTIQVAAE